MGMVVLLFACITGITWYAVLAEERHGLLTVSFLDVGQGDAVFIDAPSGRQALIDGGANRAVLRELARVMPWYDRSIDVVIGTHPDQDHIGGLVDVLARYDVSHIMHSSVEDEEGPDAAAFHRAIADEVADGADEMVATRGQIIDLGDGAFIEILFPDRDVAAVETNTGSVVAKLIYGDTSFMLTGDAPQEVEEYLVRLDGQKLDADVLKAGHHGSRSSSSLLFVGFVSPEYAVISRGCDNSYGHPHEEVLALYKRFSIQTLDTCERGTVTFVSDGQTVAVK
jgi:competence protein ComEC